MKPPAPASRIEGRMQLFNCPFCGERPETEFHFAGEAGNQRPSGGPDDVTAESWTAYLYLQANPKGAAREIWTHLTCRETFLLERDTASHEVLGAARLDPA
jgi:sarcosine oxidase subunit delta